MKKVMVILALGVLMLMSPRVSRADERDDVVKRSQDAIEASGQQMLMDVDALIKKLKEIVEKVDVAEGNVGNYQEQVQEHALKILRHAEVMAMQTILGVLEKIVAENKLLQPAAVQRIVEFFNVTADEVEKMKDKGMSLSDIVLTYAVSKAAQKEVSFVTNLVEQKKSWVQIAEAAELKFMQLGEQLKGFVPSQEKE